MEEREREKSTLGASSQRRTEAEAKGGQPESFRETLGSSGNVPQAACGDLILTSRRKTSSQNLRLDGFSSSVKIRVDL